MAPKQRAALIALRDCGVIRFGFYDAGMNALYEMDLISAQPVEGRKVDFRLKPAGHAAVAGL